ncbi:MAG TPA: DUF1439 domain-containing protein [Herminiimonas sp.]|nr:DUF1439 domain-containing protein [Herminiimonas sp.]
MPTRLIHRFVIVFAAVLLSACAIFNGPRTIVVPTTKLQASLDKRFPLDMRYMELFDLHAANPKLRVLLETDRVALSMDVVIAPPFLKKTWKGSVTLSGTPQLDALRHAVVIIAPRLDAFDIDGLDPKMSRQITQYGSLLAEQILHDVPVVTYEELHVPFGGSDFVPTKIGTSANGLMVTFEPAH